MVERSTRTSSRRDEILDGLIELFLAEGFADFSIEELSARMQCSKSTLYDIAASKEQLITTVVRAFFRRSTDQVEAELRRESDPTGRIGTYLGAIARALAPASEHFYADLQAFAPALELYSQNTAIAARRVRQLAEQAQEPGSAVDAAFLGMAAGQVMGCIQSGEMEAMTGLDDAAAYRNLANLIISGVSVAPERTSP